MENEVTGRESVDVGKQPGYTKTAKSIELNELKRAGVYMCYAMIGLVSLISLIMMVYFLINTYSLRSLKDTLDPESVQAYKDARGALVDDALKISEGILGKLLPVLTLLLGYIFGSREGNKEGD